MRYDDRGQLFLYGERKSSVIFLEDENGVSYDDVPKLISEN